MLPDELDDVRVIGPVMGRRDELRELVIGGLAKRSRLVIVGDVLAKGAENVATMELVSSLVDRGWADLVPAAGEVAVWRDMKAARGSSKKADRDEWLRKDIAASASGEEAIMDFLFKVGSAPAWWRRDGLAVVNGSWTSAMSMLAAPTSAQVEVGEAVLTRELLELAVFGDGLDMVDETSSAMRSADLVVTAAELPRGPLKNGTIYLGRRTEGIVYVDLTRRQGMWGVCDQMDAHRKATEEEVHA